MRSRPLLAVFARYPVPGRVKTRLARDVGDAPACTIYRACTDRTLRAARRWAGAMGGVARIYSAGRPGPRWSEWLGPEWRVLPQKGDDLGDRMSGALHGALEEGFRPVLCVGTDLPGLTARHLKSALKALRDADVVLGPAADGGYYLIGLDGPAPGLFRDIPWSTSSVLDRTLDAARRAGLRAEQIETLNDLDTVEDLRGGAGPTSAVIPARNEEGNIARTVRMVRDLGVAETIVVDGHSTDHTADIAREAGATVLRRPPGRGRQLNAGADAATGETLWFIHADCRLEPLALWELGRVLEDQSVAGGAFRLRLEPRTPALAVLEYTANLRSRFLGKPYGDQAMFVRRGAFDQVGGFPDWPLMEDVEMARRIREAGRLAIVPSGCVASSRRWLRGGVLRRYIISKLALLGYRLGEPPEVLQRLYERGSGRRVRR